MRPSFSGTREEIKERNQRNADIRRRLAACQWSWQVVEVGREFPPEIWGTDDILWQDYKQHMDRVFGYSGDWAPDTRWVDNALTKREHRNNHSGMHIPVFEEPA